MPGIAGKFFREFGWTAATAVLFSLLVARLLTPMMAAYLLKAQPEQRRRNGADAALPALGRRGAAPPRGARCGSRTALFVASLAIVPLIPATFIPIVRPRAAATSASNCRRARASRTPSRVAEQARAASSPAMPGTEAGLHHRRQRARHRRPGQDRRRRTAQGDAGARLGHGRTTASATRRTLERDARARLADLPGVRVSYISTEPGELMQLVLAGDDPRTLLRRRAGARARPAHAAGARQHHPRRRRCCGRSS